MKTVKAAFCWVYAFWLSKLVATQSDPLVAALNILLGSKCKYCMATRAILFGAGLPLLWFVPILGAALIAVAVGMTLGEKYWLCEVPPAP